ncbi:MAG: hypothetical protein RIB86_00810, partial [Imperialibacter sp.]
VVNLKFPLTAVDRVVMSIGIFMMIISWGGLMQARPWSIYLEMIRLLYMSVTCIVVLHANEMAELTGWEAIVALLTAGGSLLYLIFIISKPELEPS